jgi:hypothetical protein
LPTVILDFNGPCSIIHITDAKLVGLNNVTLEKKIGQIIPDVLASANGELLSIEIRVTHPVDSVKLKRIIELGLSTLEIDLSKVARNLTLLQLETLVIGAGDHKKWLYNTSAEAKRSEMLSASKTLPISKGGFYNQVYGCPLWKKSTKKGKPYADLDEDCCYCEHALDISSEIITCSANDLGYQKQLF